MTNELDPRLEQYRRQAAYYSLFTPEFFEQYWSTPDDDFANAPTIVEPELTYSPPTPPRLDCQTGAPTPPEPRVRRVRVLGGRSVGKADHPVSRPGSRTTPSAAGEAPRPFIVTYNTRARLGAVGADKPLQPPPVEIVYPIDPEGI